MSVIYNGCSGDGTGTVKTAKMKRKHLTITTPIKRRLRKPTVLLAPGGRFLTDDGMIIIADASNSAPIHVRFTSKGIYILSTVTGDGIRYFI